MKYILSVFTFVLVGIISAFSQTSPYTFGEVSRNELETKPYPREKGAEAVVLCDYATAKMIYNDGFKIEFTRHVRIKIFKSTGYSLANIQIPYTKNDRLLNLKAFTHNLEDNQPVKVALARKQFYLEKVNSYRNVTRFSFPNVREGSVIEYTYTLTQDEIRKFCPFRFQRTIPVRYTEYQVSIPQFFKYTVNLNQNNVIQQKHSLEKGYYNTMSTSFDIYRWSGNNIPPFQPEPEMPESDEYLAGVDFALTTIDFPGGGYYEVSPTYGKLSEELLNNSNMGRQIDNTLLFSGKVKEIIGEESNATKKLQAIYDYVQLRMKWNGNDQLIPDVTLSKAHRDKTGTNAEINLLLVNMLRTAGLKADPVVLSTRENGSISPVVAIAGNLNYVICLAHAEGKEYLLDATDKFRPLGMLPFKCLNVEGWILNKTRGRWITLLNKESFSTQEFYDLTLNESGELKGHANVSFSGYDAINLRRLIHTEGETGFRQDEIANAGSLSIENMKITNLDSLDAPLKVSFDIIFRHNIQEVNDMSFFKPMISLFGDYVNTWVKDERNFPIDKGCPTLENFSCRIHLPDNYEINELPKDTRILMPDNAAKFIFGTTVSENNLVITYELKVLKTRFETKEYPAFREFYTLVNKKCNEMIILKDTNNL